MVPTEVLAVQHYKALCGLLSEHGLGDCRPILLTGSTTAKERKGNDMLKLLPEKST